MTKQLVTLIALMTTVVIMDCSSDVEEAKGQEPVPLPSLQEIVQNSNPCKSLIQFNFTNAIELIFKYSFCTVSCKTDTDCKHHEFQKTCREFAHIGFLCSA